MDLNLKKKRTSLLKSLLAVEKITILYAVLTTVFIIYLYPSMNEPLSMLIGRVGIFIITLLLAKLGSIYPNKFTLLVRIVFPMALLSYWYPDTYEFNRLLPNLDHIFASIEQSWFGFQPAIVFSEKFSKLWMSEAFHLGYFAYYPMIAVVTLSYFFVRYKDFSRVAYILVGAFFLYYIIYMVVPVAGPQFYFPVIGLDNVAEGIFPAVGDYFNHTQSLDPGPGHRGGLFYQLVEASQQVGERPTAAFPSSHVGISTILLILSWKLDKGLFGFLIPFYLLLCGATVYIQAHYAIDIVGGWISAIVIYGVVLFSYNLFFKENEMRILSSSRERK